MKNHASSCLKNNLGTLIYLSMPTDYASFVYAKADASLLQALAECAYNALYGEIDFTEEERQFLRQHVKDLVSLSQGKKIKAELLHQLLAPVIGYVCEGTTKQDVRGLRECSPERSSEESMADCGEGKANPGHQRSNNIPGWNSGQQHSRSATI